MHFAFYFQPKKEGCFVTFSRVSQITVSFTLQKAARQFLGYFPDSKKYRTKSSAQEQEQPHEKRNAITTATTFLMNKQEKGNQDKNNREE